MNITGIQNLFGRNHVSGDNILHEIVQTGSLELLRRFRDNYVVPLDSLLQEVDLFGRTCIHVAADTHRGHHAILIIQVLTELGADLNARDCPLNMTVLHIAVYHKDYELAKWLCQQPNLDINATRFDGLTAYEIAYLANDHQMINSLTPNGVHSCLEELNIN